MDTLAQEYVTALGAVSESPDVFGVLVAIHRVQEVAQKMRQNMNERVSVKYTPEVLRRLVAAEIQFRIKRAGEMRDAELAVNDDLRSKGTPYVERIKKVDLSKIAWCNREESRLTELLSTFHVRPLSEWFGEVEYEAAKSLGMEWVIRSQLKEIVN